MKKNRVTYLLTLLMFLCIVACVSAKKAKGGYSKDLVPDEKTAITIAEAVWLPIYGDKIYEQKPFKAYLIDNKVWLVNGTLKTEIGGVVSIKINKSDCKVLEIFHGK